MNDFIVTLSETMFFGVAISLICYGIGTFVNRKVKFPLANPLLIAAILLIVILKIMDIEYETYLSEAKYISYLLTPATVCLAVPLYEKLQLLKDNLKAVLLGIFTGIVISAISIWGVCVVFSLDESVFATMLPKSTTTAIGMAVSEEMGGVVNITVAMIAITGISGNVLADWVLRLFRVTEPVARGIAIGTSSHVMGTSKALEMGETEGAMSGLAVAVAGLITVLIAPLLVGLY
ncbi:MAG: LrgB family protein [Lachnospiraceae bacterium]|nr:LrgB family protein [Lachnospiraceae bacterium]